LIKKAVELSAKKGKQSRDDENFYNRNFIGMMEN